jgi:hypothetical protein
MHTGCWWKKPERKSYLEELGVDRRIILSWMLNIHDEKRRETTRKTLV